MKKLNWFPAIHQARNGSVDQPYLHSIVVMLYSLTVNLPTLFITVWIIPVFSTLFGATILIFQTIITVIVSGFAGNAYGSFDTFDEAYEKAVKSSNQTL